MSAPRRTSQTYERLLLSLLDEADRIGRHYDSQFWIGAAYAYRNAASLCSDQELFSNLWAEYVERKTL